MSFEIMLIGISLILVGYGFFSGLLNKYGITGPMAYTAIGFLLSPIVFGNQLLEISSGVVKMISQLGLIIVLFNDSSSLDIKKLKNSWKLTFRLLFVAMPISIIMMFLFGRFLFPDEPQLYIILLVLILIPTDAALGKSVVSDSRIPKNIRNSINIESGLNDGIAFPLLLTVLFAISGLKDPANSNLFLFFSKQIFLGAIMGVLVGFIGGKIGLVAIRKNWISENMRNLIPIALAILAFYFAEEIGGNGYIASFFGGLFLGNTNETMKNDIKNFSESQGELLVMLSFIIFGLVLIPLTYSYWDIRAFSFAILTLTLLRIIPVIISFWRTDISLPKRLFIGWFGPRGIASVLYILISVQTIGDVSDHVLIFSVATLTVLLSIILHGISSLPIVKLYSKKEYF